MRWNNIHELHFNNFIADFEKLFVHRGKNEFKKLFSIILLSLHFISTPNIMKTIARLVVYSYRNQLIDLP